MQGIHDFEPLMTEGGVARMGTVRIVDRSGDNQNVIHHRREIFLKKILDPTHIFLFLNGLGHMSKLAVLNEIQGLWPYDV